MVTQELIYLSQEFSCYQIWQSNKISVNSNNKKGKSDAL
jgi:hypothetical protein